MIDANGFCLVLHRCNEYGDHRELGRDGDILFCLCGNGDVDAADAEFLIEKLLSRLTRAQPDQAVSVDGEDRATDARQVSSGS